MQDWKGELNSSVETNLLGHGQFSNCTNTESAHIEREWSGKTSCQCTDAGRVAELWLQVKQNKSKIADSSQLRLIEFNCYGIPCAHLLFIQTLLLTAEVSRFVWFFFPKLLQVPFAVAVRKWQLVQGEHPGECWWQNGICWSYNLSREKCVLIPHEVLWQVRNYAKKCDLGSPSLQTLILGTKEQIV